MPIPDRWWEGNPDAPGTGTTPGSRKKPPQPIPPKKPPVVPGQTPGGPPGPTSPPPVFPTSSTLSGGTPTIGALPSWLTNYGDDVQNTMRKYLEGILGGHTRYSPEVIAGMKLENKSATSGAAGAARDALRSELARTGQSRSAYTARGFAQIEMNRANQYGKSVQDIMVRKANADFDDKMAGLDRMQKWLQDARAHVMSVAGLNLDRDKALASISLAMARLNQERDLTMAQLQQNQYQFNERMSFDRQMNMIPVRLPDGRIIYVPISGLGQMGGM